MGSIWQKLNVHQRQQGRELLCFSLVWLWLDVILKQYQIQLPWLTQSNGIDTGRKSDRACHGEATPHPSFPPMLLGAEYGDQGTIPQTEQR